MGQSSKPIVVLFFVLCLPGMLLGQATVDLESGTAALQRGDLETARSLLESAAQDLPDSVEAQLALAECYLKLGQLDTALDQYRKVLKLSPDHNQAKAIVEAMTGQNTIFEQKLASARALMRVGAFYQAAVYLNSVVEGAANPQQRSAARLLRLESLLWSGNQKEVLSEAMELAETAGDEAIIGPSRIVAALALLRMIEEDRNSISQAEKLVQQAGAVAEPWSSRSKLVDAFAKMMQPETTVQASIDLRVPFAEIPGTDYRQWAQTFAANNLLQAASVSMGQGSTRQAVEIVWPMLGSDQSPAPQAGLMPVNMNGGWLDDRFVSAELRARISRVFVYIGQAEYRQSASLANLFGYWLAAEYNRQAGSLTEGTEYLLGLAGELAQESRPLPKRKPGQPLSPADQMQQVILLNTAWRVTNAKQKGALVDLVLGQIQRYEAAGDLAEGLGQFVTTGVAAEAGGDENDDELISLSLTGELAGLGPGPAHQKLLVAMAAGYSRLGKQDFDKAAATQQQAANVLVNRNDRIALTLMGQVKSSYVDGAAVTQQANEVVERYSAAGHWAAALAAVDIFHARLTDDSGPWAAIQLKLGQAAKIENQRMATNRKLGEKLPDLVSEAIGDVVNIVASDTSPVALNKTTALVGSLVERYAGFQRIDLAEAVIDGLARAGEGDLFADWAVWSRINLLERQAAGSLSSTARQLANDQIVQLDPFHKSELELIDRLLAEHDDSDYRSPAVARVRQISDVYQNYRAYEVATKILQNFLQANAGLTSAEQFEYRVVQIAIHKAQHEFSQRPEPGTAPSELSTEYGACIDLLNEFLMTHPTGDYSVDAENQLFGIVTVYGNAGAWNVAREVLDRFATAIPDFRSPQHLKLLKAATWLGELDRQYGVALLTPAPPRSTDPASYSGPINNLAANLHHFDSGQEATEVAAADDADMADGPSGGGVGVAGEGRVDVEGVMAIRERNIAKLMEPDFGAYHAEIRAEPSDTALAQIRQSQQRQFQQLAMMEDARERDLQLGAAGQNQARAADASTAISLPTGSVLSEAEMKRQDEAADQAYEILTDIIGTASPDEAAIKSGARAHVMWLFGFFEGQLRNDRAIALINRYLTDQPDDPARVALVFQAINDQLTWAAQRQPDERVNLAWLDKRHERFEAARELINQFIVDFEKETGWVNRALMLSATSYQQEAEMTIAVSNVRAGGLLVRSADALIALLQTRPDHPQCPGLDQQLWNIAERLRSLGQLDGAIYVLSQVPIRFPTNPLAQQSVLRIAELHAVNLSQPLKAVETYQEFLSLNGDNENVRSQIFEIARQLAQSQRYLESLHVYGVFVDSFPGDPRAAEALQAMGLTHQTNEAWEEAIQSYQRILSEYEAAPIVPQVKLAVAECHINLSHWREARKLYEEFVRQYPDDGQVATAQSRLELLKKLDRYDSLLADAEVQRHKDDAQFEIGRIVRNQFNNPVKAIQEFEKVVANFPNSDLADDAQLEIGKAYLALNRMEDARRTLLQVPASYPTSPLADDALYLVAQSYEQQATRLASVTLSGARALAFDQGQKGAYRDFNESVGRQLEMQAQRRLQLRSEGKSEELALDEASQSFRQNSLALSGLSNTARRAEQLAETESALQVANRQDRINEANREAIKLYMLAATDYPLGDKTDDSLLRVAEIFETQLKDRPAAMQTYQKIVELFPGTPVAEDAAWNVALFHQQEGRYEPAADALRDFIRSYPASSRIADAQFSLAEVLEELGRWVDAMDEYETFRQKFSDHPRAVVAQDQINWIRTYRK